MHGQERGKPTLSLLVPPVLTEKNMPRVSSLTLTTNSGDLSSSSFKLSSPAIVHGFTPHNNPLTCTLPTDNRELFLQKLTYSSVPYEIIVNDSRVPDMDQLV
jgi:hypothetical protein